MQNMKRRHSGHMHQGHHGSNGGRRPQGGQQGRYGFQKPQRKNYAALREKYVNMARDAMASGDRVLAEYYLQYADHYFRMQQEFLAERAANQRLNPAPSNEAPQEEQTDGEGEGEQDMNITNNSNVLPAFLTHQVPAQQAQQQGGEKTQPNVNWEEE